MQLRNRIIINRKRLIGYHYGKIWNDGILECWNIGVVDYQGKLFIINVRA